MGTRNPVLCGGKIDQIPRRTHHQSTPKNRDHENPQARRGGNQVNQPVNTTLFLLDPSPRTSRLQLKWKQSTEEETNERLPEKAPLFPLNKMIFPAGGIRWIKARVPPRHCLCSCLAWLLGPSTYCDCD
jgi:hypothetical protein